MVTLEKEQKTFGTLLVQGIVCTIYAVLFYLFICFISA